MEKTSRESKFEAIINKQGDKDQKHKGKPI
jgi:hypothetical protein